MYTFIRKDRAPNPAAGWNDPYWSDVPLLAIDQFHPKSSDHRPPTEVKAVHSTDTLHLFYRVVDRYVRCLATELHGHVWEDACVEFFVRPRPDKGYFNFETNCGGAMLLYYIEDPTRAAGGFKKHTPVPGEIANTIQRIPSLPSSIPDEITTPTTWTLKVNIPLPVFEHFTGPLRPLAAQRWTANFYKCASNNSHPHWASWSPIGDTLSFHQPNKFATIAFGG